MFGLVGFEIGLGLVQIELLTFFLYICGVHGTVLLGLKLSHSWHVSHSDCPIHGCVYKRVTLLLPLITVWWLSESDWDRSLARTRSLCHSVSVDCVRRSIRKWKTWRKWTKPKLYLRSIFDYCFMHISFLTFRLGAEKMLFEWFCILVDFVFKKRKILLETVFSWSKPKEFVLLGLIWVKIVKLKHLSSICLATEKIEKIRIIYLFLKFCFNLLQILI